MIKVKSTELRSLVQDTVFRLKQCKECSDSVSPDRRVWPRGTFPAQVCFVAPKVYDVDETTNGTVSGELGAVFDNIVTQSMNPGISWCIIPAHHCNTDDKVDKKAISSCTANLQHWIALAEPKLVIFLGEGGKKAFDQILIKNPISVKYSYGTLNCPSTILSAKDRTYAINLYTMHLKAILEKKLK